MVSSTFLSPCSRVPGLLSLEWEGEASISDEISSWKSRNRRPQSRSAQQAGTVVSSAGQENVGRQIRVSASRACHLVPALIAVAQTGACNYTEYFLSMSSFLNLPQCPIHMRTRNEDFRMVYFVRYTTYLYNCPAIKPRDCTIACAMTVTVGLWFPFLLR